MATNDEIRAKDIIPHKIAFSEGDGFYGDGDSSFFMEADALLSLTSQNAFALLDADYFSSFEQGGLAAATGEESVNSRRVRTTGYSKLSRLFEFYAPLDWIVEAFAYTSESPSGYLGKITLIFATTGERAKGADEILAQYPTAVYVRFSIRDNDEDIIAPSDVISAGLYGKFELSVKDLKNSVDSTHGEIEGVKRDIAFVDASYNSIFEQGTLAAATGAESVNSRRVRTNFGELLRFDKFYAPLNWIVKAFAYTTNDVSGYLGSFTLLTATADVREKGKEAILAEYPAAKYVRFTIQDKDDNIIAPSDVITAGLFGKFWYSVKELEEYVNPGQYLYEKNLTLTANKTYKFTVNGQNRKKNGILLVDAMYSQGDGVTSVPHIYFVRPSEGYDGVMRNYYDQYCYFGMAGTYSRNMYRIPPYGVTSGDLTMNIVVPEGVTVKIREIALYYDDSINREYQGVMLCAHGGNGEGAPHNTMAAFEAAAKLGYRYCITIPKVTSDGVLVCFHDDDNIQGALRNDDGSQIAAEYRDRPISDFTYAEILQFDAGIARGKNYAGERVPTLESFFAVCAKTGMHPMLSVHPSLGGYWDDIKALAVKYNLLEKLNIKSAADILYVPMSELGDEIESYTIDELSASTDRVSDFDTLKATYNITKARCVLEYGYPYLTDALISNALANGYCCGVANGSASLNVKPLIEKGVSVITEDYNCSAGLNW